MFASLIANFEQPAETAVRFGGLSISIDRLVPAALEVGDDAEVVGHRGLPLQIAEFLVQRERLALAATLSQFGRLEAGPPRPIGLLLPRSNDGCEREQPSLHCVAFGAVDDSGEFATTRGLAQSHRIRPDLLAHQRPPFLDLGARNHVASCCLGRPLASLDGLRTRT